jgi:hypothetical protein
MNKNFQALAGESLKKPRLTIANGAGLLDGQIFKLQRGQTALFPLFVKNEGDKKSGSMSIRLFASSDLSLPADGEWERIPGNDPEYPFVYYFHYSATPLAPDISPQETWSLVSDARLQPATFVNGMVTCKLDIFYDAEKPAEAKFILQL